MKATGNTVLITGGGSGIGRGLAEAFHKLGNQVIIAGRGNKSLDETVNANAGMKSLKVDMTSLSSIKAFSAQVTAEYPSLNAVIHCAGVMIPEDLLNGKNYQSDDDVTVNTNLLGPIRLTEELLPAFRKQPHGTIMTVTSGLAFVPLAMYPTYCATKAGIHSYTQSLRYQLKDTPIQVIELIPPYVATTLTGEFQAKDPNAMPLNEFISETMDILTNQPNATEICVKRVYPLRFAEGEGQDKYQQFLMRFNEMMTAARQHRQ